jgi:HAD superfamily hydrolase (TIGR01484 family)
LKTALPVALMQINALSQSSPLCETLAMPERRLPSLAQVAPARLRAVRGVLTDIDDTLTRDGAIEPAALAALGRLRAHGLPVIAVTGRPAGWSEGFATTWPVLAIVAENGGVMLRRSEQGVEREFAQDTATRARNLERLQACAEAILRTVPGARLAQDSAGRLTDIAIDHGEFAHLDAGHIAEVVALMQAHGLTATVSSIHVNGWLGAHTKWSGAQWAVRRCTGEALAPAAWLYVGDSTNDQAMFERIPLSVAVANIDRFLPVLTVLPAAVTRAERGHGFAEVVDALLAARDAT